MELLRSKNGRILFESHRGAESVAPANSWVAIKKGFEMGADLIEIDVQLSADMVPFIRHNYTLDNHVPCRSLTMNQLDEYCGTGEYFPRLLDVFIWAKEVSANISLDMKGGFGMSADLYKTIIPLIKKYELYSQLLVLDWSHLALLEIRQIISTINTRAMIRGLPIDLVQMLKKCEVNAVSMSYDLLTRDQVDILHKSGIAVMLAEMWQPDFQYADDLGVDIISWGGPTKFLKYININP